MRLRLTNAVRLVAVAGWIVLVAAVAGPATSRAAESTNLALGKRYALSPAPSYGHCTDPGDMTQLTDGKSTADYFWTQKGTVGWQRVQYATVTVDLGQVESIGGVALTTAAGTAGVTWPMAIQILVSDDGKTFYDVGDLVALDLAKHGPWSAGYAIRRLVTNELSAVGRFVQFVMIPMSGGPYSFLDEIEVFRRPAELQPRKLLRGQPTTARIVYEKGRLQRAVQHRWQADSANLETLINQAELGDSQREQQLKRLAEIQALKSDILDPSTASRIVLPLGPHHAELFRVQAGFWRAIDRAPLTIWTPDVWDPVELITVPPQHARAALRVDVIRGEYRAVAINLANSSDEPLAVRLRFEGLPKSPQPNYVTLQDVQWTDTSQGIPIAAALPDAKRTKNGWTVNVLPGLIRQVWMTFHVVGENAGDYSGTVVLEGPDIEPRRLPIQMRVWPFQMPTETTLWLGGWSYTNGGAYGVTPQNRAAFLAHMKGHYVNAPWATSSVLRSFQFEKDDPTKIQLDTESLDDWIDQWPDAKTYMVFLSVAHHGGAVQTSLGGAKIGTDDFDRRVATWISAWVRHLRTKGLTPDRLALLIHDEPHEGSDISALLTWAKAIRAAEPDVLIWEDPTYRNPSAAPAELFDVCDILCPNRPMWLGQEKHFAKFYRDQREKGRTLQSYSCSGPAKLLDPYSYHRLQAWHCWDIGGTGSFFWAFGDNSGASSWNEYYAKAGPFTPLFLDDSSVTAGKHMEAIRESVQDYEYFVLLKAAVSRANANGRSDAAVRHAQHILENAAAEVLRSKDAPKLRWHEPKDRTAADSARLQVLEALLSLK